MVLCHCCAGGSWEGMMDRRHISVQVGTMVVQILECTIRCEYVWSDG